MRILVFSAYDPIPSDQVGLLRYGLLANELVAQGHKVVYVTSSFFHLKKQARTANTDADSAFYPVLLPVPSYKNHIGFRRLRNHKLLAKRLAEYLNSLPRHQYPDMILGAIPPLGTADVLSRWAAERSIPFVPDVQDLWPEAIRGILPFKNISGIFLKPMYRQAQQIISGASGLAAVSEDYIGHYSKQLENKPAAVFHLGTDTEGYAPPFEGGKVVIQLGHSQGPKYLIPAAEATARIERTRLLMAGQGEKSWQARNIIKSAKWQHAEVIPWLEKEQLKELLPGCAAGLVLVNPHSHSAFPNRVFTYWAAGLPIVSNIRGGELEQFISANRMGITIPDESAEAIEKGIRYCMEHFTLQDRLRIQRIAQKSFDSRKIYREYARWLTAFPHKP